MFNEKDKKELEKELNKKQEKKDETVQIQVKAKNKKFNNPKIKYKKDKKKYIVAISSFLLVLSLTIGSSYAYLTYVSKTNNSVTISAGTLALTFQNEENIINIENAVPMKDQTGLAQDQEYNFDIKNTGTIPATYKITLDNTCQTSNEIDLCIPDEYIKVGLKVGSNDYKVVERNEKNEYIIETGSLGKNSSNSYKMKVWLAYDTPNTYNAAGGQNIVYSGKLGLTYEQGTKVLVTLDANGGTIPSGQDWTGQGEIATKTLTSGTTYGNLPTPTRTGYTFAGWTGKNLFNPQEFYEIGKNYRVEKSGDDIILNTYSYQEDVTQTPLSLKESTQYTLSFDWIITAITNGTTIRTGLQFYYVDSSPRTSAVFSGVLNDNGHIAATSNINKTIEYISSAGWAYSGTARLSHIQIEEGTEETSYEPYKEYDSNTVIDNSSSHTLYAKWAENS